MKRALAASLVLVLSTVTLASDDVRMLTVDGEGRTFWPGWRGPSAQGYVVGSGYPDTWSDTENVLWTVAVPGAGNSSPIVWGERIFLTTARDGGERWSILCVGRSDGT